MKKNKRLMTIILLSMFLIFFMNQRINLKINNFIKDIIFFPYHVFAIEEKLDKDKMFLESELANKNKELLELKELLKLSELISTYKIINATVINRNMEYFYDEVIINKGTSDGIKNDMVVINNQGLIGKILKANKNNSIVKLITSADVYNMLSIQINLDKKYVYGILNEYDENTNSFIIEGIDENIPIEVGSLISTTGLGNIYPSGINIGKVTRIQKDNFDLAYILKVEPLVDFNNFHYVAVLDRRFDN